MNKFLRKFAALTFMVALLVFGSVVTYGNNATTTEHREFELRLFELINEYRLSYGVEPLIWHESLESLADWLNGYVAENNMRIGQFGSFGGGTIAANSVMQRARHQYHFPSIAPSVFSIEQRTPEEVFSSLVPSSPSPVWLGSVTGVRSDANFIGISRYRDTFAIITSEHRAGFEIDSMTATLPIEIFRQRNQHILGQIPEFFYLIDAMMEATANRVTPDIITEVFNIQGETFEEILFRWINVARADFGLSELSWHYGIQQTSYEFANNLQFNTSSVQGPNMRSRLEDANIPFAVVRQHLFHAEFGLELTDVLFSLFDDELVHERMLRPSLTHIGIAKATNSNGADVLVIKYAEIPSGYTAQSHTMTTPPATQQSNTAPNLTTASNWAYDGINRAFAYGLIPQNLQSQYTQTTTRSEFAAFAVALYETITGREITERMAFNDSTDIDVQKMGGLGVVTGVGGGNFNPNGTITREQAAVMLARLASVIGQPLPPSVPTFADNNNNISSWAVESVGQIQAAGIMGGVGNNNFAPNGEYTREQSIITMLRLFEILN